MGPPPGTAGAGAGVAAGVGVEQRATAPISPPLRVLLFSDDAAAVGTARATLEASGFAACVASGRDEADRLIDRAPPDFAVLDRSSCSEDADALATRLAAAGIPFMFSSAADDASLVQRAIDTGAMACFNKPLDPAALVPAIPVWMARAAQIRRLTEVERSLRNALLASRTIGTAVGVLMERGGVNADSAFETLRRRARHDRLSVRRLAARIVGDSPAQSDAEAPEGAHGTCLSA
jgi:AmiR/NasT family two-component response regulator